MEKMILCLRRRADLSVEEFRQHWRDVHAPIVARHAATLGITRYVQVYALDGPPSAGRPEGFDGIGEVWIENIDAFRAAVATPQGGIAVRALAESDVFLTDVSRSPRTFGREVTIIG